MNGYILRKDLARLSDRTLSHVEGPRDNALSSHFNPKRETRGKLLSGTQAGLTSHAKSNDLLERPIISDAKK
jgi:hypothetical protein